MVKYKRKTRKWAISIQYKKKEEVNHGAMFRRDTQPRLNIKKIW